MEEDSQHSEWYPVVGDGLKRKETRLGLYRYVGVWGCVLYRELFERGCSRGRLVEYCSLSWNGVGGAGERVGVRLSVGCQRASQSLRAARALENPSSSPTPLALRYSPLTSFTYVYPSLFPQYRVHPLLCYKHATMLPAAAHPAYLSELSCRAVVTPSPPPPTRKLSTVLHDPSL